MRLQGHWLDGYVLERQYTLSSDFLGHDSLGNPKFDTRPTELGELVFRLKNRSDKNTLLHHLLLFRHMFAPEPVLINSDG